jgi:hypothetical protein
MFCGRSDCQEVAMKRVVITGGSGFIGRALTDELLKVGYEVIWLSRNRDKTRNVPSGVRVEKWDGRTAQGWGALANGATAIVNLAGESIGIPPIPWTAARKERIRASRVDAGKAIVEAARAANEKPRVIVQASAVGYYGARGDEIIIEKNSAGSDFLSQVAMEWEASTAEVESLGVRRVVIRTGLPLHKKGGVFPFLVLPFKIFFGGPIGNGRQWLSWIHLADQISANRFLIENESARGAFNLTAPNPLTNADFGRVLARVLRRPFWFPVPAFALKLALGEMAESLLLSGQRVVPERLQQAGYQFKFDDAERALRNVLNA